jgi:hypothetical protein
MEGVKPRYDIGNLFDFEAAEREENARKAAEAQRQALENRRIQDEAVARAEVLRQQREEALKNAPPPLPNRIYVGMDDTAGEMRGATRRWTSVPEPVARQLTLLRQLAAQRNPHWTWRRIRGHGQYAMSISTKSSLVFVKIHDGHGNKTQSIGGLNWMQRRDLDAAWQKS